MNNDFNIEKKKKSNNSENSFIPNIPIIPDDTLKNPVSKSTNNKLADSHDPGKISVSDEPTIFIPSFDERVSEKQKDSININKAIIDSSNKMSGDNKISKPVNSEIISAEKKPFKVKIEDDGFLSSDSLKKAKAVPPVPPKKKFEVHIEDNPQTTSFDEHTPKYNGEVYFSNRKPSRKQPVVQQEEKYSDENSGSNGKAKKVFNSAFLVFSLVVIIFTSAFSALAITCINDVLSLNGTETQVKIVIPNGATTDEIIDILDENGLIKQKLFCKIYYKAIDYVKHINDEEKPAPPVYLSGVYYVTKDMGLEGYLNEFKEVQKTADTITLVFPEGWTIYQIFDKIDEFGVCSKEQLIASLEGTDFEYSFIDPIPENSNRTFALEGYLYPATYEFYEKSDANTIIRKFLEASEEKWTEEYETRRVELGLTRDEVIIIASIIQREAADKDQMPLVSSVIHNRLDNSVSWPTLGCDSTDNYISAYVKPNVTPSEAITLGKAYDTYSIKGLPPGPICNPGNDAIYAALYPEDTNYFYFRHDKFGKIYMAETQAEHDENGREVLRANSR